MDRKTKQAAIGTTIALVIILIVVAAAVIKKLTPSNKVMELTEYYKIDENEVLTIMQDKIYEKKALLEDGTVYLDYETVNEKFNKRFYFDANENILTYTTPTEIIKAEVGSKGYYVNKSKNEVNYEVLKIKGDQVYVAIDFVKQYSDMRYEQYNNPNRIVIQYNWGDYLFTNVKKPTQLRVEPNIKSDILMELTKDQLLMCIDTNEVVKGGFTKVMTEDGVIGYVKNKFITESYYETIKSDYKAPEYTHITEGQKVNLVWHQVTNNSANNNVLNLLEKTKGVTVISPTWFKVSSNEGTIESLADETYVERAHSVGVQVWALIDDFSTEVNMYKLLSYTSRREKLINTIIAETIKYNIDGINIDFENISLDTGIHYIQFIRELSVKCRSNGIVLSIDNYVPSDFTAYFDREEQGTVADYVIIMAYDEHHAGSEISGSVSSINFVKNAIDNTLAMVPKERIIMAIPFYTRLWKEVTDANGTITVSSEAYSMTNAKNLLSDYGATPEWDEETAQYYAQYESDGATYKMWLEEEESIEAKMKLIDQADVAGVASWKLGLEKEDIWNVIMKYIN
jgi:spore germination protein YaaH